MPRFRQISQILETMKCKENIRNVGVIAHIDHGKTTMTDSLLAEAGLIPHEIAGTARVLDYLEEEQRRGITIKTANISLLYQTKDNSYVINLIDTPGHLDFAGKVTRALRATDGVIVVVDAVEEIMAQTRTVLRQALEERVRPVLFINKVDRLIREMKLSEKDVQSKFTRIINDFNSIIEIYGEEEFIDKWKADPIKESVVFGSALEKWAFTIKTANEKNVKFNDIAAAYMKHKVHELQKLIPLHEAILTATIRNLPNPAEAQKFRIRKIWKGKISSEMGQAMVNCDANAPTVVCVTNVQAEVKEGLIATGRVFAGSVSAGDAVYLVNAHEECKVKKVSLAMGGFREAVDRITAGNIVALTGLDNCRSGETAVDPRCKADMVPFEQTKNVSEPVMTMAIEPENPKDLPRMIETIENLAIADPNIVTTVNRDTGEYLLSGVGELHLEITLKSLKQISGIMQIEASHPMINYRESVEKKGAVAIAANHDKTIVVAMQAQPAKQNENKEGKEEVWLEDGRSNVLTSRGTNSLDSLRNLIVPNFQFICKAGPLCGESLRNVRISLVDATIKSRLENPDEVVTIIKKATFGSILTAKPILLEPIYRIEITTPTELLGQCTRILALKRGKIQHTERKGMLSMVSGYIPVAETFGLSTELRSSTSGQAFWQLTFDNWRKVPEDIGYTRIRQIREKKGLPSEIPKPETFASIL